jgi:hypothetical protein
MILRPLLLLLSVVTLMQVRRMAMLIRHCRLRAAQCLLVLLTALQGADLAYASWLDSDYWCRVYGCVVTSDGNAYDIYDVYNFSTGRTVPVGSPLIPWSNNPHQGSGIVDPLDTGTLTPAQAPGPGQSEMLGIDQNGDLLPDVQFSDSNGNGFLDLGDSVAAFSLNPVSDILWRDGMLRRSFYIASRTDFYLYARSSLRSASGPLATRVTPDQTGLRVSMVQSGNDSGFAFGSRASNPRFRATTGITSLQDVWGNATRVAEFRRSRGTHGSYSSDVAAQSVRVDFEFRMPPPDFSLGTGSLNYQVEYLIYNR